MTDKELYFCEQLLKKDLILSHQARLAITLLIQKIKDLEKEIYAKQSN